MDWGWVATVGIWLLWATVLAVLFIGLNAALQGLAWCSLRSLRYLNGARYVAERMAQSDRIVCDGERLCYSPRAQSNPPSLFFARNVAGWPPGVITPEDCAAAARDEISGRSVVLGMVAAALGFAWIIVLLLHPGATDSFVSFLQGGPSPSADGLMVAVLLLLSILVLIHTIYPFRLSIRAGSGLSPAGAKGDPKGDVKGRPLDDKKSAQEARSKPEAPDNFIGSPDTIEDLNRFCLLQRRVLGARHESVFVARYYRSLTLFHLKRYDDALTDIATYGDKQLKALGESNYWTLKVRYLKAVNLAFLGNWPAALEELEAVAPLQVSVLGASHPDTLMTRSARVTAWVTLERCAEALEDLDHLLPDCERVLGVDDQFTASNSRARAIALRKLESAPHVLDGAATPSAVSAEAPELPKTSTPPSSSLRPDTPLKVLGPRKLSDTHAALPDRQPTVRRLAPLAGAALLGALAVGAGVFATTWAQRRDSSSTPPEPIAEASPEAARPPAVPFSEAVAEPVAIGPEDEHEAAPLATGGPMEPAVDDYAASMIAARNGAKVREAPNREAPVIVHVEAGSALRVTGRTEDSDHQWYRVVLPDRRSGFVRGDVVVRDPDAIEDYTPPSAMAAGEEGANVRAAPRVGAPLIVRLEAGSQLRITGRKRTADHTWFRIVLPGGRAGFVREDVVEPASVR